METVNKNDFVEIEFTGTENLTNRIFDTSDKEEAKKIGIENPENIKPMVVSVGNHMLLQGLDESIEGKELNKEYTIILNPEKAFGKRNPGLIRVYSINAFKKNDMNPYPGLTLQLDNHLAKVISVTGGRVTLDFNNPLAGKEVNYRFKIIRKITDEKEKIDSLQDYFFKQRFKFDIKGKKVIFEEQEAMPFIQILAQKFKEITGYDFEIEKKDENPPKNQKKTRTSKQQ